MSNDYSHILIYIYHRTFECFFLPSLSMGRDPLGPNEMRTHGGGELGGGQDAQVRGKCAGKQDVCVQVRPKLGPNEVSRTHGAGDIVRWAGCKGERPMCGGETNQVQTRWTGRLNTLNRCELVGGQATMMGDDGG